jgi:kynureninase
MAYLTRVRSSSSGSITACISIDPVHITTELFDAMEMILANSVNPWTGRFVDKVRM